jgi:hypothetical protein
LRKDDAGAHRHARHADHARDHRGA